MLVIVKAKCKKCGNESPADQFKLHYAMRLMVCPTCFSGKTDQLKQKQEAIKNVQNKPPGWDAEDIYLEKFHNMKQKDKPQFEKIHGTKQMKCTCHKCKFEFKYDPFVKRPRNCPYCNEDVPRMNTYNLL
jgi:predicted Zn-ribbon and HTH transcriptional regulator